MVNYSFLAFFGGKKIVTKKKSNVLVFLKELRTNGVEFLIIMILFYRV